MQMNVYKYGIYVFHLIDERMLSLLVFSVNVIVTLFIQLMSIMYRCMLSFKNHLRDVVEKPQKDKHIEGLITNFSFCLVGHFFHSYSICNQPPWSTQSGHHSVGRYSEYQ